jgi:predicted short-subunit dehydrogenase-like oxidoreductase (DUF2520 family)
MPNTMTIVCIGAGNVATHLAQALYRAGYTILQIISRTEASAEALARTVNARWTNDPQKTEAADIYLYAVSDSALEEVIRRNPQTNGLHVHTAGSMSLLLFEGVKQRGGVLYPLQTFSKAKPVDFKQVPLFIEASTADDANILKQLGSDISNSVLDATSAQRRQLHLAAVFACNFTNHLFTIANDLLKESGLPFDVLHPLIRETVEKIATLSPREAQTGPAIRKDANVMEKHLLKLSDHPQWQEIYRLLSESIMKK